MNSNLIDKLLDIQVQNFIETHQDDSIHELILKYNGKTELPIKEIAEQIQCRKKASRKLPGLSKYKLLYKKVSLEQASSELTASYKSSRMHGKRMIDLTGGLGIDSIYFSKKFEEVYYCELNEELADLATHNFNLLGIKNIKVIKGDSIDALERFKDDYFDWIYADPSRRNEQLRSVDIKYLKPDVVSNIDLFRQKSGRICFKLAPAFDLTEAYRLFPELDNFEVVSVNNECKEVLLFITEITPEKKQTISAIILNQSGKTESYRALKNNQYLVHLVSPDNGMYFYEPDVAIRKAGLTGLIAERQKLSFISNESIYLVSNENKMNFPGRKFLIESVFRYNPKEIMKYLDEKGIVSANIARSDFPNKPDEIKNTLKLKDGGQDYLFFTKDFEQNLLFIHTSKID